MFHTPWFYIYIDICLINYTPKQPNFHPFFLKKASEPSGSLVFDSGFLVCEEIEEDEGNQHDI